MKPTIEFAPRKGKKSQPPAWVKDQLGEKLLMVEARLGTRLLREKDSFRIAAPIGCGSYGCVFLLEDDRRVLKVTDDFDEGPYSRYIQRLQKEGARTRSGLVVAVTVQIYDVFPLFYDPDHEDYTYGIVMERVDPECDIPSAIEDAVDTYVDGWEKVCKADKKVGKKRVNEAYAEAETEIAVGLSRLDRAGVAGKAIADFLRMVQQDKHPLTDPHHDNLCRRIWEGAPGTKKGQIVLIDFGVSKACSAIRGELQEEAKKGSENADTPLIFPEFAP